MSVLGNGGIIAVVCLVWRCGYCNLVPKFIEREWGSCFIGVLCSSRSVLFFCLKFVTDWAIRLTDVYMSLSSVWFWCCRGLWCLGFWSLGMLVP